MATVTDNRDEFDALLARIGELPRLRLTVGVHGVDGRRTDADGKPEAIGNVGIAAVHEFGAPSVGVPQRSYIRSTIDRARGDILDEMDGVVDRVAQGASARSEVAGLGLQIVEEIRETVRAGIAPPLAESTMRRRAKPAAGYSQPEWAGKQTPLIDTGQLIQSVKAYVARDTAPVGSGQGAD